MISKANIICAAACCLLCTVHFSLEAQVPANVPTDGLVGWWPFNGNANDESGNGQDGTPINGPVLNDDRLGNANSAYEFTVDGAAGWGSAQQYIDVPYNTAFNSDELTFSSWVYPRTKPSPYDDRPLSIFSRWNSSNPNFRYQVGYSNTIQIQLNDVGWALVVSDEDLVPFNTWSHVAMTYDQSKVKLYVNGVLVKEELYDTPMTFGESSLTSRQTQMTNGNWLFFDGFLDELGYWGRALADEEILMLYQGQISGCTDSAACNYNADATEDDGSCVPGGCTDSLACNYNDEAGCDDGTCFFANAVFDCEGNCQVDLNNNGVCDQLETGGCSGPGCCGNGTLWDPVQGVCIAFDQCPADVNGDGVVDALDILALIASYGSDCP